MRLKAPLMSPYDHRAVESHVAIARRIASISAAPASGSASTAAGVDAHLLIARPAAARRSTSRPTTNISTAPPTPAGRRPRTANAPRHPPVPDRSWPQDAGGTGCVGSL